MNSRWETLSDAATLEAEAARALAQTLRESLEARGTAAFAGAGGGTTGPIYRRLSAAPLDWSRVTVTLVDERWVPADHPDSNEGLLRRTLLQGPAATAGFIPLHRGGPRPELDAEAAARDLAALPAPLDAVLLGMGEDGHIASLFPGSPALARGLDPAAPLCLAVPAGDERPPAQARLTLPAAAVAAARSVLLAATGEGKRRTLEHAAAGDDPSELPVRAMLQNAPGLRILWAPEAA